MVIFIDKVYDELIELFAVDKAEDDKLLKQIDSHIFIETEVYKQIQKSGRFLLVGRKGSGKSGLIFGYRARERNKKRHISSKYITFDDFPSAATVAFFVNNIDKELASINLSSVHSEDIRGELKDFLGPAYVFRYAWTNAILYFCTYIAIDTILGEELASSSDSKTLAKCKRELEKKFPFLKGRSTNQNGMFYGFLTELLGMLVQSLSLVIKNHNSDKQTPISDEAALIASIVAEGINIANEDIQDTNDFLKDSLKIIKNILSNRSKSVLITLDKFDDFLYDIYQEVKKGHFEMYVERNKFFMNVIEGLVLSLRDIKRWDKYAWIGSLLTVPKDKFMELELRETSQIEKNHYVSLDWTAKELFKLVKARFDYVMKNNGLDTEWKHVFSEDINNCRVAGVKENPFLYVLRHSLWRPRELLNYYCEIFKLMKKYASQGVKLEIIMRQALRDVHGHIIENEIIAEFQQELPNLRQALRLLETRELSASMPYHEFTAKLSRVTLPNIEKSHDVAKHLFYLGVIGTKRSISTPRYGRNGSIRQNNAEVVYEYCYNCNDASPVLEGHVEICFHPLFFEYLSIKTSTDIVVNQLEWDMFKNPDFPEDDV